ncbi:MAG: DNA repair protein RecN, partial [Desulfuromonadales bacterium]|nr:DNA repair protein RecN [Desulfuromonadales bacterium]
MLLNLIINNFAIIDRLEVEFGEGFNVLTGETGAGKSIIMGAVGLLLGDRASPDLVRSGAEEATVEALFDVAGHPVFRHALEEAGFPSADDLVLRRVVSRTGRSRAYINGSLVTLTQLQPLAEQLVSVCGQHEHQALLHRDAHLATLDLFGGFAVDVVAYRETYLALQRVAGELEKLSMADRERQQRIDFLRHQSQEIDAAQLVSGEEEDLAAERLLLQNAERLAKLSREGYETLYGSEGAVCEQLGHLADELLDVGKVDPQLAGHEEIVRHALYDLEDVAAQLRDHLSRMTFEPGRQEEVESRLDLLAKLKRKYAPGIEEVLAFKEVCDREIEALEHAGEKRDALQADESRLTAAVQDAGRRLTLQRRDAAKHLETQVAAELADLAMPGTRFHVALEPLQTPAASGLEKVEFLIAPNQGEALMPLGRVASGGELSRILLALKRVAPELAEVPSVIFDEVDAGIGGMTATAVGRKLYDVSRAAQVLCVTHLPQVAAFADRHFSVVKGEAAGRTQT